MAAESERIKERSVDSLQQIYAVVIALAIAQTIESLLKDPLHGALLTRSQIFAGIPACLAFLVTLVPFWHGMNRHLDRCYLEKRSPVVHGALLLDFGTFFLEASLLFAVGWSLRSGIQSFILLGLLLLVDMVWGIISHQIHFPGRKSHVLKWSKINLAAIALAILVVAYPFQYKPLVLMFVAILRSIVDYSLCWDFYFPSSE
jgi:VanZ family protein